MVVVDLRRDAWCRSRQGWNTVSPAKRTAAGRRWWLWLPLFGLAAWLALFGDRSPDGDAAAVSLPVHAEAPAAPRASSRPAVGPSSQAAESLETLVSRDQLLAGEPEAPAGAPAGAKRDLFSTRNWNPPPPPPPPAVVPAPMAPPLPFAFLGKKLEGQSWEVYLSRGEQTFIVREGQTFDGAYRIDKIAPPVLTLTYVPLNQAQTLTIGDTR